MGYWKGDSRFSKNMTYMIVNEKGLLVSSAVDELPVPVMGWLGLTELNPTVVLKDGTSTTLAALNDVSHRSFKEIADVIEANFKL